MAKQLVLRKGTTTEHQTFTGVNGEITLDTTRKTVIIHDGTTSGGFPLVSEAELKGQTGSSLVGYRRTGQNVTATLQTIFDEELNSVKRFNVKGDGVTDDTSALIAAFTAGGDIYVPEGNYFIAGIGPDSGGVYVTITKSTKVVCHPNARFFTDSLDNDFIRFTVPSNGTGLPAAGIKFEWYGGYFDQSNQKVSTVVPYIENYAPPSAKQGASATCDGLSVRGDYTVNGSSFIGIRSAIIGNVTTYAGDHWQTAGGDSGIFVGGCEDQIIFGCKNIGNRDLGVYASGVDSATLPCRTIIENNTHINCFFGVSVKRSTGFVKIHNNHAENCVGAVLVERLVGDGSYGISISNNTGNKCGIPIRIDRCTGFYVSGNLFRNLGSVLSNGTSIENVVGVNGIITRGSSKGVVEGNQVIGMTSGTNDAYGTGKTLLQSIDDALAVKTTNVLFIRNIGVGLRSLGNDVGENNSFVENTVYEATTSANLVELGTNCYEVRLDPNTNLRSHRSPLLFADGTISNPILARSAQPTVGLYFATNAIHHAVAGVNRVSCTNVGVGFNGATPSVRPIYITATGTPTRSTFDTATVTTAQLAERVKALIDDLKTYGLLGG